MTAPKQVQLITLVAHQCCRFHGHTPLGYLSKDLDFSGQYYRATTCTEAMINPQLVSGALVNPGYSNVGLAAMSTAHSTIGPGTDINDFALMIGTAPIAPNGSPPVLSKDNSYDNVLNHAVESNACLPDSTSYVSSSSAHRDERAQVGMAESCLGLNAKMWRCVGAYYALGIRTEDSVQYDKRTFGGSAYSRALNRLNSRGIQANRNCLACNKIVVQIGIEWSLHRAARDPDPNAKFGPFMNGPTISPALSSCTDTGHHQTSSVGSEPSERVARPSKDKAADDYSRALWRGRITPHVHNSRRAEVEGITCPEFSVIYFTTFGSSSGLAEGMHRIFYLSASIFSLPLELRKLPLIVSLAEPISKHLAQRINIARRISNAEIKFREIRLKNSGGAGSLLQVENLDSFGSDFWTKIAQWQLLKYQRDARKLLDDFDKVLAERTGGRVAHAYRSAMANVDERAHAEAPPSDVTWTDVFITRHPSADPSIKAFIILELNPSHGGPNLLTLIDELLLEAPLFPPDCHALKF
ncbi:hypothetical protein M407DRAFT_7241 [Tulasnella calospora MUT 4182]|uniref:Uncharacterized protein n=1 Tax=Tulasnella calospora MUT 4182 TaxID=1051891 RepID=A0A0C3QK07_9AGAM|nr:hypothetical protein M407DRAFT_7241 [Tulasnella calospora MUT 4182]